MSVNSSFLNQEQWSVVKMAMDAGYKAAGPVGAATAVVALVAACYIADQLGWIDIGSILERS